MTTETEFDKQLTELLTEIEQDIARLESRLSSVQADLDSKNEEREHVFRTRELYRQKTRVAPTLDERLRQRLAGKTVREMIIELAKDNEPPKFRVVDINTKLVEAGMFNDRRKASESVYSAVGRDKRAFLRLGEGEYLYVPEFDEAVVRARGGSDIGDADIVERVNSLRALHPEWNRRQVTDALIRSGFNFGSRKPIFAVGAVFMRDSRSTTSKQPALRTVSA